MTGLPDELARERREWALLALSGLAQAYGPDEPDYPDALIKQPNPLYEPRQPRHRRASSNGWPAKKPPGVTPVTPYAKALLKLLQLHAATPEYRERLKRHHDRFRRALAEQAKKKPARTFLPRQRGEQRGGSSANSGSSVVFPAFTAQNQAFVHPTRVGIHSTASHL